MTYKEMIIDLLGKINDDNLLKRVYKLLEYIYLQNDTGD